jgi:hypothetical protein
MPEESRSLGKVFRRFGLSKQERSKGKDDSNRQDGKVTPPAVPTTPSKSSAQTEPAIQPEQLWDQAYDDLKHDEPKLFRLYERILSYDLGGLEGAKENIIEQTHRKERQSQMYSLLNTGLDKTEKLAKVENNISDAINIVLSIKKAIGSGLQAVPIAALAWAGVCVALQASLLSGLMCWLSSFRRHS